MEIRKLLMQVRNVFGVKRVYPLSEDGRLLLELTGRKAFNDADIEIIKKLGYTIEFVPETLDAA